MAAKAKTRPAPTFPDLDPLTDMLRTPPLTTEDRLRHLQALGDRISSYVRFMCAVGSLSGVSAEAKQCAVTAFYERLKIMERQLGSIKKGIRRVRRSTV